MRTSALTTIIAIVCATAILLTISGGPARSEVNKYVEDFTTTTYKDVGQTDLDWNTADGELKFFPFTPTLAGTYDTPDNAFVVHVEGNYAYVADRTSGGLQVIDITDPAVPTLAGSYDTPGLARGLYVDGNYAYVADGASGLQVIDISDPTTPTLAGTYNTADFAYEVFVAGNYAYVADNLTGLLAINITNPAAPTLAGSYDTPHFAYAVFVAGDHAYVADDNSGLHVIDISDPTSLTLAGSYDTPGNARGIWVAGNHAYVADGPSGLQVLDISDPTTPTLAGSYDTPDFARGITIAGDRAYVADGPGGLQMIDISDPTAPTFANSFATSGVAGDVMVAGTFAFVADGASGLQVITISEVIAPVLRATYNSANALGIFVSGDLAYVANGASGILVLDISNPGAPSFAGGNNTAGSANGIYVAGDYAYVAGGTAGLQVIDISNPAAMVLAATRNTPGDALNVFVSGNWAYVADLAGGGTGMAIYNIADPTAPVLAGTYVTPGASGVHVSGIYAYLAVSAGLRVIDVSNKAIPVQVGVLGSIGTVNDVYVSGDYAYVAGGSDGLQVIDISDPTTPFLAGDVSLAGDAYDVYVDGDFAFVATGTAAVYMIDISNPANPTALLAYSTAGDARGVFIAGDQAFVASGAIGVEVVQFYQREVPSPSDSDAFSLSVDGAADAIVRARVTTAQVGDVVWFLSNNGIGYNPTLTNSWYEFTSPGSDLRWAGAFVWTPVVNPVVSQLTIEWLNDHASIAQVVDIANDQGRQASVEWMRSGHDFAGDASQIVEYAVYREIDPGLSAAASRVQAPDLSGHSAAAQEHAQLMQGAGWHFITIVPVRLEDDYAVVCPTLADSTVTGGQYWTTFMVSALTATPGVFFDSPPDSGFSTDDLAPSVPASFAIAYNTGNGNTLVWDEAPDTDFQFFRVYRSTDPNFVPTPAELVHATASPGWMDPDYDGWMVYYKVTATDFSGNESDGAVAGTATAIADQPLPNQWALYDNVPNPFNPVTQIRYYVPVDGGDMSLRIYDVRGRLIRTLVTGPAVAGERSATWDGRDDRGNPVSSGVYFYRLTASDFTMTKKMVLAK